MVTLTLFRLCRRPTPPPPHARQTSRRTVSHTTPSSTCAQPDNNLVRRHHTPPLRLIIRLYVSLCTKSSLSRPEHVQHRSCHKPKLWAHKQKPVPSSVAECSKRLSPDVSLFKEPFEDDVLSTLGYEFLAPMGLILSTFSHVLPIVWGWRSHRLEYSVQEQQLIIPQ
jgi:hypothetical protein